MDLINQFIENYKRKMNFYETAGRLAAKQLEASLQAAGIRRRLIGIARFFSLALLLQDRCV